MGPRATVASPVRRLWQLLEPYHALTYFAPEAQSAFEDAGLRGFWRGYFAGRAAPLGAVEAGPVTAAFFGFHSAFVARAIPSIWTLASPEAALGARLAGVAAAVRRLWPGAEWDDPMREAATLLRGALDRCPPAGRPLFAANLDVAWPDAPALQLWQAATLVREHRGDGHVVALLAAGIGPCQAHVTQVAASGAPLESITPYRGWTDDDWESTIAELRSRGWLEADGGLTPEGRAVRQQVEDDTDRLAADVTDALGDGGLERVLELLTPLAVHLADTATVPYPNPMGVPDPRC